MQSNGKSATSLPAPTGSDAEELLLEAWREALAEVLDTERKQWQRQRELIEAQAESTILKLRAEVMELRHTVLQFANDQLDKLTETINARLSQLKDGADGRPGDPGVAGERGEKGDQGGRGEPGERGERGERGEQGLQGEKGAAGEPGLPGERGEKGDPGEKGERGDPGPQGEKGDAGEPGERGERGDPGEKGERGEDGKQGEKGETGEQGEQGTRGEQGERGEKGEAGQRGEKGEPGTLNAAQPFVDGAVHYEGDVVLHLGGTYQARCDTARAPPHDDWVCIAAKGRDAPMPKIIGTYREGESYSFLNIVALGGSSFIARSDDPGPCPGEGWQLIASAGHAGKQGPKGERGEAGQRGERGLPAPYLIGWTIDREAYTVKALMSDDTEWPALELRGLFEQFHDEAG
jgi:hypothetical protein